MFPYFVFYVSIVINKKMYKKKNTQYVLKTKVNNFNRESSYNLYQN